MRVRLGGTRVVLVHRTGKTPMKEKIAKLIERL
jgi:hypothetical protein